MLGISLLFLFLLLFFRCPVGITPGKSILKDDLLKTWLGQALKQCPGSTFQVKVWTCGTHASHTAHRYSGSSTHPGEDQKLAGGGAQGGRLETPRLTAGKALIIIHAEGRLAAFYPSVPSLTLPPNAACAPGDSGCGSRVPRLGVAGVLPLRWPLSISHFSSFQPCWSLAKQVMGWPWAILDKPPVPGAWPWMMWPWASDTKSGSIWTPLKRPST